MEAFRTHTGIGVPLRRSNVDTDQIIPAVYLKRVTRTGFEDGLFQGPRIMACGRWLITTGDCNDDPHSSATDAWKRRCAAATFGTRCTIGPWARSARLKSRGSRAAGGRTA